VNHLLELSANEIDKILTFVKYVLIKDVSEDDKESLIKNITENYENKLKEVEELYNAEIKDSGDAKIKKSVTKLYEDNKDILEKEFNRVKSIISDLKKYSTILESDYRNIFYQFSDVLNFGSGPDSIFKMLQ
jgi:ATP-dependent Zn protease